jgi:hypothetical protein
MASSAEPTVRPFVDDPRRNPIVLRSDFVEAIHRFAARPQYYNTQREDQKGGHFPISSLIIGNEEGNLHGSSREVCLVN